MKKTILIFFICLINSLLYSQSIEIFGGSHKNIFFDYRENQGHFQSAYTSDFGYNAGIGVGDIKFKKLKLRFTLSLDKYSGHLEASDGGLGGGYTTKAEIEKSIISLGIFPLNLSIKNKLDFNVGFEISRLVNETFTGTHYHWQMWTGGYNSELNEIYSRYSNIAYFGLKTRIAYNLNLSESIVITPQYSLYFGLTGEFYQFPQETKSMRHYLGIGIKKKWKKQL